MFFILCRFLHDMQTKMSHNLQTTATVIGTLIWRTSDVFTSTDILQAAALRNEPPNIDP